MNTQTQTTSFTPSLLSRPAAWQSASLRPIDSPEARAIAEHKWYLSERLGRDVGMRVAELDYRLNVQPKALVEKTHWFLVLLERLAASHGVRALAEVNYTARGGMTPFASPTSSNFGSHVQPQQRRAA